MADVRLLLKETTAARNQKTTAESNGKKRKASAVLNSPGGKKPRPASPELQPQALDVEQEPIEPPSKHTAADSAEKELQVDSEEHAAELAALDRELALMEAETINQAAATISAPPMTADEIAKNEQGLQRASRDAELEAEREDAAKALEEEFEAMDGLEERAKRLRARREALRHADSTTSLQQAATSQSIPARRPPGQAIDSSTSSLPRAADDVNRQEGRDDEDNEDDDEEDDDDLGWSFGRHSR